MTDGFTARWVIQSNILPAIIASLGPRADAFCAKAAHDIEAIAKANAPVDTGTLRNSIKAVKIATAVWRVIVGVEYGLYVEWGTVHMAAQPYLQPAVNTVRPQFLAAMRTLVTSPGPGAPMGVAA